MHPFCTTNMRITGPILYLFACLFSCSFALRVQSVSEAKEALIKRYSRQAKETGDNNGFHRGDGVFGNDTMIFQTPCVRMETTGGIFINVKNSDAVGSDIKARVSNASSITVSGEGCDTSNGTVTMTIKFSGADSVEEAEVWFEFKQDKFTWWISNMSLEAEFKANGSKEEKFEDELYTQDIKAGRGNSYLCGDQYAFTSGYKGGQLQGEILFTSIILRPFVNESGNATWGQLEPCEYAFTLPLWMATVTGLIMSLILALGISMLVNIKTPDRFDDPKTSKLLAVPSE